MKSKNGNKKKVEKAKKVETVEVVEKSNTLTNVIVSIISLLALGIIFYIIYINFIKVNNVDIKGSELSAEDVYKLGKEKYDFISSKKSSYDDSLILYKASNVDIYNIDNKDLLLIAYSSLSKEDKNIKGTSLNECFLNNKKYTYDTYPDTCQSESFDKNILQEQITNHFDSKTKIKFEEFNPSGSMTCVFNNKYKCYLNQNDVKLQDHLTLTYYSSSELNNNRLSVYSYVLSIRKVGSNTGIFSDVLGINKIDSYENYMSLTKDILDSQNTEKLFEKYKDKLIKYRATFLLENNNFVFYSNEIVSN